jgi:hypothetical protein
VQIRFRCGLDSRIYGVLTVCTNNCTKICHQKQFLLIFNCCSLSRRKYYREYHPLLGIHYLKLGKINLYLNKFAEALDMLKNAERVIRVTHGERHTLYRDQLVPLLCQAEGELGNTWSLYWISVHGVTNNSKSAKLQKCVIIIIMYIQYQFRLAIDALHNGRSNFYTV